MCALGMSTSPREMGHYSSQLTHESTFETASIKVEKT